MTFLHKTGKSPATIPLILEQAEWKIYLSGEGAGQGAMGEPSCLVLSCDTGKSSLSRAVRWTSLQFSYPVIFFYWK